MAISYAGLSGGSGSLADEATLFLLDSPTTNELDSFLSNEENLAKFRIAISGPHTTTIASTQTAMDAVVSSQIAMGAGVSIRAFMDTIADNPTILNSLLASQTAMDAVVSSQIAMDTLAAKGSVAIEAMASSQTALGTLVESSIALDSLFNSSAARSAMFNFVEFEQALRNSSFAMTYLRNNFASSSSVDDAANLYTVLSTDKVFVIEADTGYDSTFGNAQARYFAHGESTITTANPVGNPWPALAGKFMNRLEIKQRTDSSTYNFDNRTAIYVVMEQN